MRRAISAGVVASIRAERNCVQVEICMGASCSEGGGGGGLVAG